MSSASKGDIKDAGEKRPHKEGNIPTTWSKRSKPVKEGKRRKVSQGKGPNSPMYTQLLGIGSPDSTPSVMLVMEHSRSPTVACRHCPPPPTQRGKGVRTFLRQMSGVLILHRALFNCGDGAQRFCNEHKLRLSKIDHIFLANLAPENTGGLLCLFFLGHFFF